MHKKLELNESIVLVADNVPGNYNNLLESVVSIHICNLPTGLTIKFLKYCTIKYPVDPLLLLDTGSAL